MFYRLWSFVLRLVDVVKKLAVIYRQLLKLNLRLTFNLILLTDNKAFQAAIFQIMKEILTRKESKWLLDGIKKVGEETEFGEKSLEKSFEGSCDESDIECK